MTVRLYGHVSGIPSDLDLYHDVYLDNTCKVKRQTHMRLLSYVEDLDRRVDSVATVRCRETRHVFVSIGDHL